MTPVERARWLKAQTLFQSLTLESLYPLAEQMQEHPFGQEEVLAEAGTLPDGIQILLEGRWEERDPHSGEAISLLPGAVAHLGEVLAEQPLRRELVAVSAGIRGWIPAAVVRRWLAEHSGQLAEALAQAQDRLSYEQERQVALRPYLVPKVERGIVGPSRYAVRLRQQIKEAAQSGKPVLIFGEPGLEKDNIAALVHFGSPRRRQPMIKVDCSALWGGFVWAGGVAGVAGRGHAAIEQPARAARRADAQAAATAGDGILHPCAAGGRGSGREAPLSLSSADGGRTAHLRSGSLGNGHQSAAAAGAQSGYQSHGRLFSQPLQPPTRNPQAQTLPGSGAVAGPPGGSSVSPGIHADPGSAVFLGLHGQNRSPERAVALPSGRSGFGGELVAVDTPTA